MKIKNSKKAEIPDLKLLLNQRCFLISGMVFLSFGLCSNILDNKPDKANKQECLDFSITPCKSHNHNDRAMLMVAMV